MMQSVAQGGIAEADASHWVGPGATVQGVPPVVVGVCSVVGSSVVVGSAVEVGVASVVAGPVVVSVGGPVVGSGPPVQGGEGLADAQAHTALAASRTGRAWSRPQASRTQYNAAPLMLAYVSGSHWHQ
jgi:hypothetical protein